MRRGAALLLSMIFMVVFATIAMGMMTMSTANAQIAHNQHKGNVAFMTAESGLEVVKYWIDRSEMPSDGTPSENLAFFLSSIQEQLNNSNITNLVVYEDGTMSTVNLDDTGGRSFTAQIETHPVDSDVIMVSVDGNFGQITQSIQVNYVLKPEPFPIFDYGIATKGPIEFDGNPTIEGVNYDSEAEIYIESAGTSDALYINGNTMFDGDIYIGNENGKAKFNGDVNIGGDSGSSAKNNHVFSGADPVEFPIPNTEHFRQYATGQIITSGTNTSNDMTLTNAIIREGSNPCFEGNIIIKGVLFIEDDNKIEFKGNVDIRGLIVAAGNVNDADDNSITFFGNFLSGDFPSDSAFDEIREEKGSSFLAPGFAVEMAGNFASIGGVMAVSGFYLSGNAEALCKGSIIDYSDDKTVIKGNATLKFDRADGPEVPAGFDSSNELKYDASSWAVVH